MDLLSSEFWQPVLDNLLHLGIAFGLALPMAWDRERSSRGPGMRTFPMVAIGCCAFLLIGRAELQSDDSQARVLYGLMTGIGFIGGGSILKGGGIVSGTATAAGIWNTGAIGAAVAWQRYEIAVALAMVSFVVLHFGSSAKHLLSEESERPPVSGEAPAEGED